MVRFYAFWAINDRLDRERLFTQLARFREHGLDGVVFQPRNYPGIPPYLGPEYLALLSDLILEARRLGLRFWLYDENGWPSGTANGEILKLHPDWGARRLDLSRRRRDDALVEFTAPDGGYACLYWQPVSGVDPFQPEGGRLFLELVHERYRRGLKPEAFEQIEAFFADEPESGATWEPQPELAGVAGSSCLLAALGAGAREKLPLLFFDGPGAAEFRVHFYETMNDLLIENFFTPYRAWCRRYGKEFTGHIKGEEHPCFQLPVVGSNSRIQQAFTLPGMDALERFPGNDFFPVQVASAARQFGSGRCLAEAFGGAGWGAQPEDLERYLLWLGRHGVTDFVLHLAQYRLDTPAIRDWPPSQPLALPWREAYAEVLARVRQALSGPEPERPRLVVLPYRALMRRYTAGELAQTNIHDGDHFPLSAAGRLNAELLAFAAGEAPDFELTDDRTWAERGERAPDGRFRLGKRVYRELIRFLEVVETPAWELAEVPDNALLLESAGRRAVRRHRVRWRWRTRAQACRLEFADEVSGLRLNGTPLSGPELTPEQQTRENVLEFTTARPLFRPFVYLRGAFGVYPAAGGFEPGPVTRRPGADLVAAGWPFLDVPLRFRARLTLPPETNRVRLSGVAAAAARIGCGEWRSAWCWGPAWTVTLPSEFVGREEAFELELAPSGFNHFGPHHYVRGDAPLISPDQMVGRRNFADPEEPSTRTWDRAWRFVPFRLPRMLVCRGDENQGEGDGTQLR